MKLNTVELLSFFSLIHFYVQPVDASALLIEVFKEIFDNELDLCYIINKHPDIDIINQALMASEVNFVSKSYTHLTKKNSTANCEQYLMISSDTSDFIQMYEKEIKTFRFRPHKNLLLIYEHCSEENMKEISKISAINGLHLITLQLIHVYDKFKLWREDKIVVDLINFRSRLELSEGSSVKPQLNLSLAKWNPSLYPNEFRIALFDCVPYVFLDESFEPVNGIEYQLIKEITKKWRKELLVLGDDASKRRNEWRAVYNTVSNGTADLGACSIWQMFLDYEALDFANSFQQVCLTFIVPKPHLLPKISFFFHSFQLLLWILMILLLLLVGILMIFIEKFHRKNQNANLDAGKSFLYAVRIFAQSGIPKSSIMSFLSMRIFVMAWIISCLIISNYYSAGLTSDVTKPRYTNPTNTIKEMIDHKINFNIGLPEMAKFFQLENVETLANLRKMMRMKERYKDLDNSTAIFVKVLRRYICDLETMPDYKKKYFKLLSDCRGDCIANYYIGFIFQKNSPYTEVFEKEFLRFSENGLYNNWVEGINYLYKKELDPFFSTYTDVDSQSIYIDLPQFQGVFILLAVGYVVSVVIFYLEYSHFM